MDAHDFSHKKWRNEKCVHSEYRMAKPASTKKILHISNSKVKRVGFVRSRDETIPQITRKNESILI